MCSSSALGPYLDSPIFGLSVWVPETPCFLSAVGFAHSVSRVHFARSPTSPSTLSVNSFSSTRSAWVSRGRGLPLGSRVAARSHLWSDRSTHSVQRWWAGFLSRPLSAVLCRPFPRWSHLLPLGSGRVWRWHNRFSPTRQTGFDPPLPSPPGGSLCSKRPCPPSEASGFGCAWFPRLGLPAFHPPSLA